MTTHKTRKRLIVWVCVLCPRHFSHIILGIFKNLAQMFSLVTEMICKRYESTILAQGQSRDIPFVDLFLVNVRDFNICLKQCKEHEH